MKCKLFISLIFNLLNSYARNREWSVDNVFEIASWILTSRLCIIRFTMYKNIDIIWNLVLQIVRIVQIKLNFLQIHHLVDSANSDFTFIKYHIFSDESWVYELFEILKILRSLGWSQQTVQNWSNTTESD